MREITEKTKNRCSNKRGCSSNEKFTLFRAGGHIVPPPPPPGKLSKISQERLELQSWNFLTFQMNKFSKNAFGFNCLRPPLVTIATPNVDACFRTTYFNSFHAKSPQNSNVFCYIYEGCPNWNLLWRFGLNIRLDGVLVTVFVSHSFSCFIDLKMNTTTTMATPMVSFDSVFHMLSEKITFFLRLLRGTRFLIFEWWFLVKNLKTMNHLKIITMVSLETKFP